MSTLVSGRDEISPLRLSGLNESICCDYISMIKTCTKKPGSKGALKIGGIFPRRNRAAAILNTGPL
jgi:hypothetical protein